jgi:hypothetical protein
MSVLSQRLVECKHEDLGGAGTHGESAGTRSSWMMLLLLLGGGGAGGSPLGAIDARRRRATKEVEVALEVDTMTDASTMDGRGAGRSGVHHPRR